MVCTVFKETAFLNLWYIFENDYFLKTFGIFLGVEGCSLGRCRNLDHLGQEDSGKRIQV